MNKLIATTTNPDGSFIKHPKGKGFDPSYRAIFRKGMYCIPITNQPRKGGVGYQDGQESVLKGAKAILRRCVR